MAIFLEMLIEILLIHTSLRIIIPIIPTCIGVIIPYKHCGILYEYNWRHEK